MIINEGDYIYKYSRERLIIKINNITLENRFIIYNKFYIYIKNLIFFIKNKKFLKI